MADSSQAAGANASTSPSLEDIRLQIAGLLTMVDGYKEAQRAEREKAAAAAISAAAEKEKAAAQNPTDSAVSSLGVGAAMSGLGHRPGSSGSQQPASARSASPEVNRDAFIPQPGRATPESHQDGNADSVHGMRVLDLFNLIDTDKSGELDKEELEAAMGEYGLELIVVENPILQAIIEEMEDDHDRCVGIDEFRKITKVRDKGSVWARGLGVREDRGSRMGRS